MVQPTTLETPPSPADHRELNGRVIWALVLLGILYGFNTVDRGLLALNLEQIKLDLHATDTQMSVAAGIGFFLFNAIAGIPLARLADRHSRRDIIAIGFGFYSLVVGLVGMVSSFAGLLVARMVQGVGEASGVAPASAMVNDLVSPRNRRKALAGMRVFSSLIVMVMLSALGQVAHVYGWRASFYVLAVPAALLVPLMLFTVREPKRETTFSGQVVARVTFREAWSRWRHSPAFFMVLLGFAISGVTLQANGAWAGAFFARVRELSPGEIGALSGLSRGPGLLAGSIIGAWLTDFLTRRNHRWRFWVPGLMLILGTPTELIYLMADPYWIWMPAYLVTGGLLLGSQASLIAVCMDVSGIGLRATGLAFAILLSNLLADLVGPTIIGVMNDTVFSHFGAVALRYSMALTACFAAVGGALVFGGAFFESEQTRSDRSS